MGFLLPFLSPPWCGVELGADSSLWQGDCLISPRMLPQLGWPAVASQQTQKGWLRSRSLTWPSVICVSRTQSKLSAQSG